MLTRLHLSVSGSPNDLIDISLTGMSDVTQNSTRFGETGSMIFYSGEDISTPFVSDHLTM